jgi:two-component system nitrogen regulation sensor histidine kinase GlnL
MTRALRVQPEVQIDAAAVLAALSDPLLVVDFDGIIRFANSAAEQFLQQSAALLCRQKLKDLLPFTSPVLSLVAQVQIEGTTVSEYGIEIGTPKMEAQVVDVKVSPLPDQPGSVVVRLDPRAMAAKMDRQLTHRGAARSVVGMAAVLAHEVKNPLSGIRGAAQLLEQNAGASDRELTRLICDETDRICGLVDRMELFSDPRAISMGAVNIHEVLEHVRKIAQTGFARHIKMIERYDPSLPPALGNRDLLVQAVLNLVKNAAEAVGDQPGGEIVLGTAYRHGVRLAMRAGGESTKLPLEVSIQDNGPGIPEDIQPHMFDAFVSAKPKGTGLGLALVAKITGDHGGVIEFDSRPRRTAFRLLLPLDDVGTEVTA